jgi:hypothetical protein
MAVAVSQHLVSSLYDYGIEVGIVYRFCNHAYKLGCLTNLDEVES